MMLHDALLIDAALTQDFHVITLNPQGDGQPVKVDDELGAFYYAKSVFRIASVDREPYTDRARQRKKKSLGKCRRSLF